MLFSEVLFSPIQSTPLLQFDWLPCIAARATPTRGLPDTGVDSGGKPTPFSSLLPSLQLLVHNITTGTAGVPESRRQRILVQVVLQEPQVLHFRVEVKVEICTMQTVRAKLSFLPYEQVPSPLNKALTSLHAR